MNKDLILREKLAIQRTHLANQSTFLAFLRTSMYFLIAALTVPSLSSHVMVPKVEKILFVVSGILFIYGISNYWINRNRILESEIHIGNYKLDYENGN